MNWIRTAWTWFWNLSQKEDGRDLVLYWIQIASFLFALICAMYVSIKFLAKLFRKAPPAAHLLPEQANALVDAKAQEKDSEIVRLTRLIEEMEAERPTADMATLRILQGQIDEARETKRQLETSEDRVAELAAENLRLRREARAAYRDTGENAFRRAEDAIAQGDFDTAETSLAQTEAQTTEAAARAAYMRGELAERDIRWQDAALHYAKAATLAPTLDHLLKASEYAWRSRNLVAAEIFAAQAIEVARKGEDQKAIARALNLLAMTLHDKGNNVEAELLYREAMSIREETLGTRHPGYARTLNNLANVLSSKGELDEAQRLYREAMSIREETLGTRHPGYANAVNNLAVILTKKGELDEAERLYREAVSIREEALGTRHPGYARTLNNLANVLSSKGELDEAEQLYRDAIAIFDEKFGPDHPDTQRARSNLAALRDTP